METNTHNIEPAYITTEMKNCYIDYAMSVIVGRALPDVRDGMKPVHRRILYAMHELGLTPDRPFRKSVRIVGDVLGKFHPHGDTAVYDAMVRMAQDFSMRYPTIQGHGNFGSIDGDGAAAMRYTEAKMNPIAGEMLRDINKDTVDFVDNFDGSDSEPEVLTARFPHLLVNGSQGIAVGMATNMPPHNLEEVIDATIYYIDHPGTDTERLMTKLPGPDFPTGGIILGSDGIKEAYNTGRGRIKLRGKFHVENAKKGKERIVITELPYMVNKAKLITKIAELKRDKKIEGINDIRDESDLKHGLRVVIETRKGTNIHRVVNELYKHTDLEQTFGIINLALVPDKNGKLHPKVLSLKELLSEYVNHQKEIITRRTRYDLERAKKRAHILEGLITAVDNIDKVIDIIRESRDTKTAKKSLRDHFNLSDVQATAILDMRLQRLTGLEREKLREEYEALEAEIHKLEKILSDEKEILKVIKKELREIKNKYKDERRTEIIEDVETFEEEEESIPEPVDMDIKLSKVGYISSGKMKAAEDDIIEKRFKTKSDKSILILTREGKAYNLPAEQVPSVSGRGRHIRNILPIDESDAIVGAFSIDNFDDNLYVAMITDNGLIKRTKLNEFDTKKRAGVSALSLKRGDKLKSALLTKEDDEVIIGTKNGFAIRYGLAQVSPTTRASAGVKGVRLGSGDDSVVSMNEVKDYVITITDDGFAKKTEIKNYKKQGRGGKGIRITKNKEMKVTGFLTVNNEKIYIKTEDGFIEVEELPEASRTNKGSKISEKEIEEVFYTVT